MLGRFCGMIALFLAVAATGCGADDFGKVIGVWKCGEKGGGQRLFVEILKDKITIDNESADVVLEDKGGKVAVRRAGRDEVISVITVFEDDSIELDLSGLLGIKLKMARSSREEWDAANNPPVENILGLWRAKKGDLEQGAVTMLEIAPDSIIVDGEKTGITIVTEKGDYFFEVNGERVSRQTVNDNGSMDMFLIGRMEGEFIGRFVKMTLEEASVSEEAAKEATR